MTVINVNPSTSYGMNQKWKKIFKEVPGHCKKHTTVQVPAVSSKNAESANIVHTAFLLGAADVRNWVIIPFDH